MPEHDLSTGKAPAFRNGKAGHEQILRGIGVSPGIAIGPAYLYARADFEIKQHRVGEQDVQRETKRFERAVEKSEYELGKIASVAREKMGEESASIFEAQALMLRDTAVFDAVISQIQDERCNADYALHAVIQQHRQVLKASESEYLRERASDLLDLQDRIVRHLRRGTILSRIDPDAIVVADKLTAADMVLFSRRNVLGCAMDFGGATSHVSIMARALGVPAVVSMHGVTDVLEHGGTIILDGLQGLVIAGPTPETLADYRARQARYERILEEQKELVPLSSETLEGHHVKLRANLEFHEELRLLDEYGADGIGLFRTEILVLMRGRASLSEEEQFRIYKRVTEEVGAAGTTFRMLDLGGDKMLPLAHREHNPFLGWRGIRVLLDKPDLLVPQLRAILRASVYGKVRLLLPMVMALSEVRRFRDVLEQVKADLREADVPFDPDVPLGIMVEVPATALMASRFAAEVDFFSIGTNDLTQYVLAVDRGNDLVADRFDELHPAVLMLIHQTVEAAHAEGIPVSLCGELASNPRATPILVGLGVDELSASPAYLPEIKRVIRSMCLDQAQALAADALRAESAAEVEAMVEAWLEDNACGVLELMDVREVERAADASS